MEICLECNNRRATHELDGGMYCHHCWNELISDSVNARRVDQRQPYEDEEEDLVERTGDPQRQLLYAAEREVEAFLRDPLPTIAKMQEFVNHVLSSPWTREHFGTRLLAEPIMVWPQAEGLDYAEASTNWGVISVPEGMGDKFIILHELAHILVDRYYGGNATESHGPQFATFYLMLVRQFLGAADCWDLLEAFDRNNVNYEYQVAWLAA